MDKQYCEAVSALPAFLKDKLLAIEHELQTQICEISLRANQPILVEGYARFYRMRENGGLCFSPQDKPYRLSQDELETCLRVMTEYSVHSCEEKIKSGYFTLKGGHRAGIVGSCVAQNGAVSAVTDINAIHIRVAREIKGAANSLMQTIFAKGLSSVLLVGAPASGKTTMLRDITRQLSNQGNQLSLIDERGEIAATQNGVAQNDVGMMTDILNGYPKGIGMEIALRVMGPKAIILDEIGSLAETKAIEQSLYGGVKVIATAHATTEEELFSRIHIKTLLQKNAFDYLVFLSGERTPCETVRVVSLTKQKEEVNVAWNQYKEGLLC